ncbi:MAG: hypothetical protein IGS03_02205 [Candidatus Sericytochromatia bacterium]|nr:hypothetical protein [Candidatus Sericytochromatia bacterium]
MSTVTEKQPLPETLPVWDLSDLYQGPDDPCLQRDSERLRSESQAFATRWQPQLDNLWQQPQQLAEALAAYTDLQALAHDLLTYATLAWSVATQESQWNQLKDQLTRLVMQSSNQLEFFRQGLTHLRPARRETLCADPLIAPYAAFLDKVARFQPYLLSESEERLLQTTYPTRRQRWLDLYTQTTSGWSYTLHGQSLTEDAAMDFVRKADPAERLLGYSTVLQTYSENQDLLAFIYSSLIQDYASEAHLRGFASTLEQQAHDQSLRAEQVLYMLGEVQGREDLFQRYYRLLARQLGVPRLRSCDLNAPLRDTDWQVDWPTGIAHVLDAVAPLGDEVVARTRSFFERQRLHASLLPGKSSGAFCAPTAQDLPYVLLNWNGNYFSLTALAHELGHALHFAETVDNTHILQIMPPLFLAETASTLNEYLLADHLLASHGDSASQRYFLAEFIQRMMNGLYRQSLISAFEVQAHEQGAAAGLDADALTALWQQLASQRYGEALETLPQEQYAWSRIPHIFMMPFYCYNYTLSNLIVLALIDQYRQDRAHFLPRYRRFLRSGGAALPQELLQMLGLDLNQPAFYRQAFGVLQDLLDRLESLIGRPETDLQPKERGLL